MNNNDLKYKKMSFYESDSAAKTFTALTRGWIR